MHSPALLERLRMWWRVARAKGKMPDGGWLFAGLDPIDLLSTLIGGIGGGALSRELRRARGEQRVCEFHRTPVGIQCAALSECIGAQSLSPIGNTTLPSPHAKLEPVRSSNAPPLRLL